MCKTFGVLPNDPLVEALTPVQIEFIIWNLSRESKAISDILGKGDGVEISDSRGANALLAAHGD